MLSFFKKMLPVGEFLFVVGVLAGCTTGDEKVAKLTVEAEKGNVDAMVEVAEMYCGGTTIAQDDQICGMWMKRAAEKGHIRAQYMLGRMYELGLGMKADPVQAYKWYNLSGEQGYRMSQTGAKNMLAIMTPKQLEEAKKLMAESEKK